MTERHTMNKPSRAFARPLRDLVGKVVGDTFTGKVLRPPNW
jgi:hypothetical protein